MNDRARRTRRPRPADGKMRSPQPFDVLASPLDGVNLVEASAGTGKTWNICGLYLRFLLERRLDVRQILVVTFTNTATAELRERVRSRIVELHACVTGRARENGDPFVRELATTLETRGLSRHDIEQRLAAALQAFDEAAILTIHGFCQRALAESPFAAGMPFAFDIQPDAELRLAVVHDFWRRHVASDACPPALSAWLDARRITPDHFSRLLERHLRMPLGRVKWPAGVDAEPDLDSSALQAAFDRARANWSARRDTVVKDVLTAALDSLNGRSYSAQSIDDAAEAWDAWFAHGDCLADIDENRLRRLATSRAGARNGHAPPRHAFFDEAEALLGARRALEGELERAHLRLLRTLFAEAAPELCSRKRDARVASYDDLLQNLHAALRGESGQALVHSLRERYPAALVDEFQDTDPVQFAIFDAIHGAAGLPLFLVGDPKQSIYRFRGADLYTYLGAAQDARAVWTLSHNQRSTPGLIAGVNALFGRNPAAFMLDGLRYRDVDVGAKRRRTLVDRSAPHADVCVWTLPRFAAGKPLGKKAARAAAAQATAAEISRLLDAANRGDVMLDDVALAPHDVAVLVRTHREGSEIRQALAILGVGSVELSQASVFASPDAEDVARVLRAIVGPADPGLLRAALATELLGLDASAIAALDGDEASVVARVQRFLGYRDAWVGKGIGVMYREMLAREAVARRMLGRADGERRLTNLLHLGELLHAAAQTHRAPDALLRWLDARRRENADDEVAQLRLESDRNLVQIVTIHKVKGLEYPIVFCPFLWQGERERARNGKRLAGREYHDADGVAVVDYRGDDELGAELAALESRMRRDARAEDLRLAYVALTRASHRCYLVAGCYGKPTKTGEAPKETRRALLNWLVAGSGIAVDDWLDEGAPAQTIDDAWASFAKTCASGVECIPLPTLPGTRLASGTTSPDDLRASLPPQRIPEPWRIGSFSGLHDGAVRESAASDHDADRAGAPIDFAASEDVAPDDILRFPRGIGAGDCLHAVFERADFADPATWDDAIARALREHPVTLRGVAVDAQQPLLRRMIERMLADVLRSELPDGIRLDAITRDRKLVELEFNLPAARLSAHALNAALASLGYRVGRLTFARLDGYLRGFIDLVFEHRGRYYLLDWKSNHLGFTRQDYAPAALDQAMEQHGYHLQSLLYAIALRRFLAQRVPDYRDGRHFGGVLYLFVRGVRPDWRHEATPMGVHFHRPSARTLARLEALFAPVASALAS